MKPTTRIRWQIAAHRRGRPRFERSVRPLWWLYGHWHGSPPSASWRADGELVTYRLPIWVGRVLIIRVWRPV